ncbi:MAG: hypothetical protein MI810_18285 [Flavobacteriales bacterium]|nr:hypothetical protein [Flavobacteriales bacterium]
MMKKISICNQEFDEDLSYFTFDTHFKISDMEELQKLKEFRNLQIASFDTTNFNDTGIKYLVENAPNIDNLSLQNTKISDDGIKYLTQLKQLKYLRLKENRQLTNKCVPSFNLCHDLIDLQLHETSVTIDGLNQLKLPKLENLMFDFKGKDFGAVEELSKRLPQCNILIKGKAEFEGGRALWIKE